MLTGISGLRLILPKSSLYFGGCNLLGALFFWISIFPKDGWGGNFLLLIGVSFLIGCVVGGWVKYRSKFSVAFVLVLMAYFFVIFPVILMGAGALVFADIAGVPEMRVEILLVYLASITLPLIFGVIDYLRRLAILRAKSLSAWREVFPGVDFEKFTIKPNGEKSEVDAGDLRATIWAAGAMVVNIPLFFDIYFGSRNNLIFIVMPVMIGMFAYFGFKIIGPRIAKLCVLRQYEKQTGRCFVNTDYEKIQELRRTFFLSRWLMKDYRPAAKS